MEFAYNVPSIEEISFKLTENLIPSSNYLHHNRGLDDSLDYTLSKASIQQMLCQDQEPSCLPPQIEQESFWKQSSLKTTCTGTTEPSTIKKPSKTFFRQRVVSSSKTNQKHSIKRRLSHHIMSIGEEMVDQKLNGIPLHSPHPAPYRLKQNKKCCSSGKNIKMAGKVNELDLIELQASMKVKPLNLEVHTDREKIYMRRVMQNRGSIINAIEEISLCPPVWTNRRNFRIH